MTTFPQPSTESAIAAGNLPKFALLPGKHDIRLLCKQFYFFHLSILEDLYKTSILPADLSPPYLYTRIPAQNISITPGPVFLDPVVGEGGQLLPSNWITDEVNSCYLNSLLPGNVGTGT